MRVPMVKLLLAAILSLVLPAAASADPITAFSIFGGNNATLGNSVNINSGQVGSNNSMTLGGGTDFIIAMGAGVLSGGNSLTATGDITFNGNVSLGGGTVTTGDIDSGGNVDIGNSANVTGNIRAAGTVTLGGSTTVTGNIDAGRTTPGVAVSLGNSSTVTGTITHKAGTTVSYGGGATAGGDVIGVPATPTSYVTTVLPTPTVFASGGASHNLGGGSNLILAPDSYNDIVLGNSSHLWLSSGTYYFDTWNLGGGTTVHFNLTSGNVLLFFTSFVTLGNSVVGALVGGDASDIYLETKGTFNAGGGTTWYGTTYGSGATSDVLYGNSSNIFGAAWATRNVRADGGSNVNYVLADYVAPQQVDVVPEPTSLVLLGAGLVVLSARLRRRMR
jgi:cytoskeletal protein CcmA (bactofilin family)